MAACIGSWLGREVYVLAAAADTGLKVGQASWRGWGKAELAFRLQGRQFVCHPPAAY